MYTEKSLFNTFNYMDYNPDLDRNRLQEFQNLRKEVLQKQSEAVAGRLETNPVPSEEEVELGCFTEMLEPQVAEAIKTAYNKGYYVHSSGFMPNSTKQFMRGYFYLNNEDQQKLEKIGAQVENLTELKKKAGMSVALTFEPLNPNLNEIKEQWDTIASTLPDNMRKAERVMSLGAILFRFQFSKQESQRDFENVRKRMEEGSFDTQQMKFWQLTLSALESGNFTITPEGFITLKNDSNLK